MLGLKPPSMFAKSSTVKYLLALTAYNLAIFSLFSVVRSDILFWLYDDKFVINNGLLHYVDFRPGYPPVGKLPYTCLYKAFGNAESIVLYHLAILDLVLIILHKLFRDLTTQQRARALVLITALYPPLIWTICIAHADLLALLWLVLSIYFVKDRKPLAVGVFSGLGFLTKVYNAILLLPALVSFKSLRERLVLMSSFLATVLTISAPFLALDPLMYISVYTHHLLRGPSETIFALLDGYFSHTGFLHPTYEATIYAWQFASIYVPSNFDHFRYAWSHPQFQYVSLVLQASFFLAFSLMIGAYRGAKALKVLSLAMLSYFTFSPLWSPVFSIPVFIMLMLATLDVKVTHQASILAILILVDSLHYLIWSPWLPLDVHMGLLTVVVSRAISISLALYIVIKSRGWDQ